MTWRFLKGAFALLVLLTACGETNIEPEPGDPIPVCDAAETICGSSCIDTSSDPRHCGGCGIACDAGESCSDGACAVGCPAGQDLCDGVCQNLNTSAAHCGDCGNSCGQGELCAGGTCGTQCPDGQSECAGGCHDVETSAEHCGQCGTACSIGEKCAEGSCVTSCPAGQVACDGGCFDLDASGLHCGACGTACEDGQTCIDGTCGATPCGAGQTACDDGCSDTSSDRANCGGCGTSCDAGELCVDGACDVRCGDDLTECAGSCRDTDNDRSNCGGCGVACGQGEVCTEGACTLSCGGFASALCDGACTNTDLDPANCGACGNACPAGQVCSNGGCAGACATTLSICDGACADTRNDPTNCGGCGVACPSLAGAEPVCASGSCTSLCAAGLGDCNGDLHTTGSDGCETPIDTDVVNCGGCGLRCSDPPGATAACLLGTCAIGACAPNLGDCDLDLANGCESDGRTDVANCGGCGIAACAAGDSCIDSVCLTPLGEDCLNPFPVVAGANAINYTAVRQDYFVAIPSCGSSYSPTGPDVVLEYIAPRNGSVTVSFDKPTSNRWHAVVGAATCGSTSPEIACMSEHAGAALAGSFPVRSGMSYFIYITDTASGNAPLDDVLQLQLTEQPCGTTALPTPTTMTPAAGTSPSTLRPEIELAFSEAIFPKAGTITVTGTLGSNHTFTLPSADVKFSGDLKTLSILPGEIFPSGEVLTVGWTGLEAAAACGGTAVAPGSWSFTMPVLPCSPGSGGMVGSAITRVSSGIITSATHTEYYVAADSDPNGYVYFGGTAFLYRTPKAGGWPEDVKAAAGLVDANLGYAVLIDGLNVYTAESKTSTANGTAGHLFRISTDGGATWHVEDMATFPSVPTDDIHSLAAHGGRIHMITHESSSTVTTQLWSIDASAAPEAAATLDLSFGGYTYCSGLVVDSTYYYTACRVGASGTVYAVLRIEKGTGAIVKLTEAFPGNNTQMALQGKDNDGDGLMDFLYYQEDVEEGYAICSIHGTPYADLHYSFGTGTGNYGLGFDPVANVLWSWDDGSMDFMKIE